MIVNLFKRINNIFLGIENSKLSIGWFFLIGAFSIFLREVFEVYILASGKDAFLSNIPISHLIWFTNSFLLMAFLLSVFLREKFEKILKIVLAFSFVILSVPLYAYVFGDGTMKLQFVYFSGSIQQIVLDLLSLNGSVPRNIPIFFEWMIILVFLTYYMIVIKKVAWYKSLVYAYVSCLVVHALLGVWFIQPAGHTRQAIDIPTSFSIVTQSPNMSFQIGLYILTTAVILFAILFKCTNYPILAFMKNLRLKRIFLFFLFYLWGFSEFKAYYPDVQIYTVDIILSFLPFFFYWIFAIHLNDINDYKIDKISNKERPLIKYKIPKEVFIWICIGASYVSFFLAYGLFYKQPILIVIHLLNFLLCFLYCQKPFYLRRYAFAILIVALIDTTPLLYSSALFGMQTLHNPMIWKLYLALFVASLCLFNIKDIKDIEGDKKNGVKNLFTIFGLEIGKQIFIVLNILGLSSFLMISQKFEYTILVIIAIIVLTLYLIFAKKPNEKIFFYLFFTSFVFGTIMKLAGISILGY